MKYLGKSSLSSVLSVLFNISWYVVLIVSILSIAIGSIVLFQPVAFEKAVMSVYKAAGEVNANDIDFSDKDWQMMKKLPAAVKALFIPWFGAIVFFLLRVLKKANELFRNFRENSVFSTANADIIKKLSRALIMFSILTFSFTTLIASVLLLILCEIFRHGAKLQEDHDLTV